jgi:hypothetical protein
MDIDNLLPTFFPDLPPLPAEAPSGAAHVPPSLPALPLAGCPPGGKQEGARDVVEVMQVRTRCALPRCAALCPAALHCALLQVLDGRSLVPACLSPLHPLPWAHTRPGLRVHMAQPQRSI